MRKEGFWSQWRARAGLIYSDRRTGAKTFGRTGVVGWKHWLARAAKIWW
jgi:hypothetical protein